MWFQPRKSVKVSAVSNIKVGPSDTREHVFKSRVLEGCRVHIIVQGGKPGHSAQNSALLSLFRSSWETKVTRDTGEC